MPKKTIIVEVNPEVFKWLRESAGWNVAEVSKIIKTNPEMVMSFESGKKKPTLRQLRDLSRAFKRPIAAFLLPKPKKEKPLPKDYRMISNREGVFDKKTIVVLRKARSLQEIGEELSQNINYKTKIGVERVTPSDSPSEIAKKYRNVFDLTEEKQRRFKTSYDFFNYLRDILENINILVFQFSMPVEDARGFVLTDDSPTVIVVNTKDSIEARLFSLMHEFAHVLLGESAIDLPDVSSSTRNKIERWCNEFASSILLPKEMAKKIFDSKQAILTEKTTLDSLSRKYKVSKGMLLFNMFKMDYLTKTDYENIIKRYKPKITKTEKKEGAGGVRVDVKCRSEIGTKFISLVANNYDRGYITYTDALTYLAVKSKNFDKVLAKAVK